MDVLVKAGLVIVISLTMVAPAALAGDGGPTPEEAMKRFRKIALSGDVDGMRALVHERKGLKDEGRRVKLAEIDRDFMLHTEFLRAARSAKPSQCRPEWKRNKASCKVINSKHGGYRYTFYRSDGKAYLVKTSIVDL